MNPTAEAGTMQSVRHVDDLADLIDRLELGSIVTYEVRGRRRDGGFDDLAPARTAGEAGGAPALSSQALCLHTDSQLAYRLVSTIGAVDAEYIVDMAVVYVLTEPLEITDSVRVAFLEQVAVMNLFPYVRQAVADCSSRVGEPVTLALLRAGAFRITMDDALAES